MEGRARVILLGWDGATWDLMLPWVEEGKLPGIEGMLRSGSWGVLSSTIPPLSPSAWTTIFTGVNPGKHGILGFMKRKPASYFIAPISSRDRKAEPIWKIVSTAGKRVVLVNIPFAYPPEPVNGMMLTGLGTPSKKSAFVYPPERKAAMLHQFPNYDVDYNEDRILLSHDKALFLGQIKSVTRAQIEAFVHLLETEEWSLAGAVFRSLDVMQHYFWQEPECLLQYYQQLDDALIWCTRDFMREDDSLILCSDHGFSRVHTKLFVNNWLESLGLLKISPHKAGRQIMPSAETLQHILITMGMKDTVWRLKRGAMLEPILQRLVRSKGYQHLSDIQWPETYASFGDASDGLIWLNLKGREPEGMVRPGQKEAVQQKIIQAALELRDPTTGGPIIHSAYAGADLYNGGGEMIPDIVLLPHQGYRLVGGYNYAGNMLLPETTRIANHALEGVFAACGPAVRRGASIDGATVADITPTLLVALGLKPLPNMDGRPLDIFVPGWQTPA